MRKRIKYYTTVGCIGEGQLARMMVQAGRNIGIRLRVLGPKFRSSCSRLTKQVFAPYDYEKGLDELRQDIKIVTYEFENVPVTSVKYLEKHGVKVLPGPYALMTSQNRWLEKNLFWDLDIPTTTFAHIARFEDLLGAIPATHGNGSKTKYPINFPAILKSCSGGYDGRGQIIIKRAAELSEAWTHLGGRESILEKFVHFNRELSIIAVRDYNKQIIFYPVVQNFHARGVLRLTIAPAPNITDLLQKQAEDIAKKIMEKLDYVGVICVEMFQCGNRLLANEIAPRVHNSGHWTIEGSKTSQFTNHLLAITGQPLGSTEVNGCWAMVNMIGRDDPTNPQYVVDKEQVKDLIPDANYHWYAKGLRPTKLGHITLRAPNYGELVKKIELLREQQGIRLPDKIL